MPFMPMARRPYLYDLVRPRSPHLIHISFSFFFPARAVNGAISRVYLLDERLPVFQLVHFLFQLVPFLAENDSFSFMLPALPGIRLVTEKTLLDVFGDTYTDFLQVEWGFRHK
jgi:hypothetical protein